MSSKPFDNIDLDSMDLLNEMEVIGTSLKKSNNDVSDIPSFKNDPIQTTRLRVISNTFSENLQRQQARIPSHVSTADSCYQSAQEETHDANGNDSDQFMHYRISSSVIQNIMVTDENENSRHLSQEFSHEDSDNYNVDGLDDDDGNNTIIMANELSSDSDFNSSFSVDKIEHNNERVSSVTSQGSTSKFKTSRIISPSQVYTLSPVMPLTEQFDSFGNKKSTLMQVLDSLSPISAYSSTFDNSFKENFIQNNKNMTSMPKQRNVSHENLIKSRQILQDIQRRVTSDILLPKPEVTNRVSSESSLKNELDKIWDTVIGDDSLDYGNINNEKNESTSKNLWRNDEIEESRFEESFSREKTPISRALKLDDVNEGDMPIQRSSTGLGIYQNKFGQVESEKQIVKGNIMDLLTKNGVSLVDNSLVYQPLTKEEEEELERLNYLSNLENQNPVTPKKQLQPELTTSSNHKISSPVKVILPKEKLPIKEINKTVNVTNNEPTSEETKKNKILKLRDSAMKNLGYLYISLDTLSINNFIIASNVNASFKDKNCQLQLLFDNGEKIVESDWVKLNDMNSKKTSFIDLSTQEFATEVPIKDILKNKDDIIFEIQITLKLKYDHPKSRIIEIQDRVPISNPSNNSAPSGSFAKKDEEADRANSLTKIFKKGNKQKNSPKKNHPVEYQTITKKITQQVPDPWAANFAPDLETFATITLPITLNFISEISHKISTETAIVKSVLGDCKQMGLLSFKALHLQKTTHVLPKSISAIQAILERKDRVQATKFSGVMYQQGLDLGEMVKRRDFELNDGKLVGSTSGDVRIVVNLENVTKVLIDSECPLPGYNFELVFEGSDNEKLLLSCDSVKERRDWLHKISELLEVLTIVRELDI
ncbi:hypothetical protein ACO0SA_003101 [Hanseniaspora valbyensis]